MQDYNLINTPHEGDFTQMFVYKKFGVCLDIGAHVGLWSRFLQERSTLVIAFEPNPDTYRELVKNVAPDVMTVPFAANNVSGPVQFYSREIPSHSGMVENHPCQNNSDIEKAITVGGVEIDSFIDALGLRVSFVKIDTEGLEEKVIQGMWRIINRDNPMFVIECHSEESRDNLKALMKGVGSVYLYGESYYLVGQFS